MTKKEILAAIAAHPDYMLACVEYFKPGSAIHCWQLRMTPKQVNNIRMSNVDHVDISNEPVAATKLDPAYPGSIIIYGKK
jgi:hypothetical protein